MTQKSTELSALSFKDQKGESVSQEVFFLPYIEANVITEDEKNYILLLAEPIAFQVIFELFAGQTLDQVYLVYEEKVYDELTEKVTSQFYFLPMENLALFFRYNASDYKLEVYSLQKK